MIKDTLIAPNLRTLLATNPDLGCGNFLHVAARTSPHASEQIIWLDRECRTFQGEIHTGFSLSSLKHVADQYAAWYYGAGVREKDTVAVYLSEGVENLIHYIALCGIGAIPILINGNMKPEIAAGFIKKVGATALYTDRIHQLAINQYLSPELGLRFQVTDQSALQFASCALPSIYPFHHVEKDPVLIGHSSGTTGIPKAVLFQHQQFFHGIRYRLGLPHPEGSEHVLSALPHSHSAGIAYVMLALLAGTSIQIMSTNQADHVLRHIESFGANMVVAFPETFVGLSEANLEHYDLTSIRLWVNGGDAAHEAHIRRLISVGRRKKNSDWIDGSIFIDGLGSSEMGFSLFRMVHTPETTVYNRCIGAPLEWVDATVIGDDGQKLPPYRVGKLGVKSPSITPGYWNDSALTMKSQVQGYWLTGDLFYYDEKGLFYHVDRVPDAIRTPEGMFYSLQTEELLMKHCQDIADCTVVGAPLDEKFSAPIAIVRLKTGMQRNAVELLGMLNAILKENGKRSLSVVVLAQSEEFPLGPTGKVLKRELREQYRNFFQAQYRNRNHPSIALHA